MSPSRIATGGLRLPKSPPSSLTVITSTEGLRRSDGDEEGVSIAGIVDKASLSDSTLALVAIFSLLLTILDGEGGEEGIEPRGRTVRRLMVTLLEVGSGGGGPSEGIRVGV